MSFDIESDFLNHILVSASMFVMIKHLLLCFLLKIHVFLQIEQELSTETEEFV